MFMHVRGTDFASDSMFVRLEFGPVPPL